MHFVARTVGRLGYTTDVAMTLQQAAKHLVACRYDAVVLDLSLAEEAVSLLHALRGMAAQAVLVLVSPLDVAGSA